MRAKVITKIIKNSCSYIIFLLPQRHKQQQKKPTKNDKEPPNKTKQQPPHTKDEAEVYNKKGPTYNIVFFFFLFFNIIEFSP